MVVASVVRKRFYKSHDEAPNLPLVEQPSTSTNKSQPCSVDDPKCYLAKHISSPLDECNGTQPRLSSRPTSDPVEQALIPTIKQPKDWSYVLFPLYGIVFLADYCFQMYKHNNPEMERLASPAELAWIGGTLVLGLLLSATISVSMTKRGLAGVVLVVATVTFWQVSLRLFTSH
jgi:hypothetical protein